MGGVSLDAAGQAAWAAMRAQPTSGLDEFDLIRAEEMMLGYHARWVDETAAAYEVLAVESEFQEPLINPDTRAPSRTFQRGGKLDAVVRERATGRTLVVEHKTTSEPIDAGSVYWRRLALDPQVSTYLASHPEHSACLYDVLGKVAMEPLKATPTEARKYTKERIDKRTGEVLEASRLYATQRDVDETPAEYRARLRAHITENLATLYRRGEVVRLPSEMAEAAYDDWQTARAIRDAQLAARWPRNADSCVRYRRLCSYFSLCTNASSPDNTLEWATERAHRELSAGTRHLPLLTASSARTFRRCAREYHWRYEREIIPAKHDAHALSFGTLVHAGLEAWWLALAAHRATQATNNTATSKEHAAA